MMATAKRGTAKPKVGDFTGKQRETLIEENAAEVAEKAKQVSMATAAQAEEFASQIHDAKHPESVTVVDEVEDLGGVEKSDSAMVVVRVNEDIEDMTYGYGNTYSMKAGGQYRVPKAVADHLERKGLVWH
jgi:hypothetical protein